MRRGAWLPAFLCLLSFTLARSQEAGAPALAPKELDKLLTRLQDDDWSEREAAMRLLRRLGSSAIPGLLALDTGNDAELAWRVRAILSAIRAGAPEDLRGLLEAYSGQAPEQRLVTIQEVVRLARGGAVRWLTERLAEEQDETVQQALLTHLAWLKPGREALPLLQRVYREAAEAVKPNALRALAGIPGDESRQAARAALKADDAGLRAAAIQSLVCLQDRDVLPELRKLARGGEGVSEDLQLAALSALPGLQDEQAGQVCRELLRGPDQARLAAAALRVLAQARDRGAAPLLLELARNREFVKEHGNELFATMGALADPAFTGVLREHLRADDPALVCGAVQALGSLGAREAGPEIAALLRNGDEDVCREAIPALAALGYRQGIPELKTFLQNHDPRLAFLAAKALAGLGSPEGVKRLLELAETGDEQGRINQEAIALLGEWRIEAARPVLQNLAAQDNRPALFALQRYGFDPVNFRDLYRSLLLWHLAAPDRDSTLLQISHFLAEHDLSDLAAGYIEKYIRHFPADARGRERAASIYHDLGRCADVEKMLAPLDQTEEGQTAGYLNNRAWFHATAFQSEHFKAAEALERAQRAVALAPTAPFISDTLGWCLHVNGRHTEAAQELRRALELREGGDWAGRAWQRTRLARALWAAGRRQEARAELAAALKDGEADAKVWFESAGFLAAIGERDAAVHALHAAVDRGFIQAAQMELNPEFAALARDPGYAYALYRTRSLLADRIRFAREVEDEVRALGPERAKEEAVPPGEADYQELLDFPNLELQLQ